MNQQTQKVLCDILAELRCLGQTSCPSPAVFKGTGAAPAMTGIHQLDTWNPTCCTVSVVTTIGEFVVPPNASHSFRVDTPFTVEMVSFDPPSTECDLASVTTTGVRVK